MGCVDNREWKTVHEKREIFACIFTTMENGAGFHISYNTGFGVFTDDKIFPSDVYEIVA